MNCAYIRFTGHAFERMLQRGISPAAVKAVIAKGEVIEEYPEDTPYPSVLLLGFANLQALHVVVARDEDSGVCHVITVYRPDLMQWNLGFKTRREL